jgi:hypothetical protein
VLLELEEELVAEPVDEAVSLGAIVKYSTDVIVVAGLVPDGACVTTTVLAGSEVEVRRVVGGAWVLVGTSVVLDVVGRGVLDVEVVVGVVVDDGSGVDVGVGVGVGVGSGVGVDVVTGAGVDVAGSLGAVVGVVVSVGELVVG